MIHLRPAATQEIQRLLQQFPGHQGFRIHLQPSDCAEWIYDLGPAQKLAPDDATFSVGDLQIVVAQSVLPFIDGLAIDYAEDLMGGGFRFVNPQAQQTCGCGNAFSVTATTTATAEDCLGPTAPHQV